MQRMRLVTINGPQESGKSWVCKQLIARHDALNGPKIIPISIQGPLEAAARALVGEPTMPYDEFKKTKFFGLTGRTWMIQLSENFAKEIDPLIFAKLAVKAMEARFQPKLRQIFVIDSNGFELELDYWRGVENIDLLATCIQPEGTVAPGQPYGGGDSRYNLSHKCGVVAADSTELLGKVEAAMRRRGWI